MTFGVWGITVWYGVGRVGEIHFREGTGRDCGSHPPYACWGEGRRRPDGPARVLLALIAKDPAIVQQVFEEARDR